MHAVKYKRTHEGSYSLHNVMNKAVTATTVLPYSLSMFTQYYRMKATVTVVKLRFP